MSPPRHISHSLLLPTTGLQVNTSPKLSEAYHNHRSPCHHLAIYLILHYYLLQVYRSTRRQNPQKHTNTTSHHVTTWPYILFSTTTYYRSTGQHVVKILRIKPLLQVTMSPPRHISSSSTTYYRSTGQHVVKALRIILYYRSTCPYLAIYLILSYYLLQVNKSSKPSEAYQYHRSPCHHLAIYLILYYYLLQVYRSKRRQNPQNQTITTGHHVPIPPYISFSTTTTYYRSTDQHVVKTLRIKPLLQVTMSPPRHISHSLLLLPTTGLQINTSSKPSESNHYYRSPCPHLTISHSLLPPTTGPQVNTSSNLQELYSTTGQHVTTSPYILFSTTTYYRSTGQHVVKTLRSIPIPQVTMSPPRHISYSLLLPTTGLQVNTSSKPSGAYHYYTSPCPHLAIYLILYYYLLQVYRSTRRQNPQNHTITTGHHVPTSPYLILYYYLLQVYRSTCRQNPPNQSTTTGHHVTTSPYLILFYHLLQVHRSTCCQSPKNHTLLQVNMSLPCHISHSLLLPTTGLQVNKSSKPSEAYQYHRSPCHHLAIYLILHYYLLQVYRSTRRQNPQNQSITTGHHVTTLPYILFSTTTYYRSTGQHVVKPLRSIPLLQVTMSLPHHVSYSLLLPTTGLQVNTLSKPPESYQYHRSPCHHLTMYFILYYCLYRSTGQHVVKTLRINPLLQVTMSPPCHISYSLLLPTTGLQVNTSSNPSEAYHYYRSPCHYLTMYLILSYYLLQVYRSTRCQNPQNHTNTTGHHVTTSPCILLSTTTYYRSTGQHFVKPLRSTPVLQVAMSTPHNVSHSLLLPTTGLHVVKTLTNIPLLQVTMSPPHHISLSLLLPTTGLQVNMSSKLQVTMSPPHHVSYSLLPPTTGSQVNTSSKPSEAYHHYRSPCHHLAIYPIIYYTSPPNHM